MRYRLRTLLILLAILPPTLAVGWFVFSELAAQAPSPTDMRAISLKVLHKELAKSKVSPMP